MKIQIIGTAAEGKTSISNLIHDLLKSHGFEVNLIDEDSVEDYTPRLRQLRNKGLKIEIETIQTRRTHTNDSTHVVSKTITTSDVVSPIGQFLKLADGKLYD